MATKCFLARVEIDGIEFYPLALCQTGRAGDRWVQLYRSGAKLLAGDTPPAEAVLTSKRELSECAQQAAELNRMIFEANHR